MSAYDDAVLADSPAFYLTSSLTDASGNGHVVSAAGAPMGFIFTDFNIHLIHQANASAAAVLDRPTAFGTQTYSHAAPPVPNAYDGLHYTPVLRFTALTGTDGLQNAISTATINAGYKWVLYDNEYQSDGAGGNAWPTPMAEANDPWTYMRSFASAAHAAGLKVIVTPARDLGNNTTSVHPKTSGTLDQWYTTVWPNGDSIAAAAASADIFVAQTQTDTGTLSAFDSLYNACASQAAASNPTCATWCEVSSTYPVNDDPGNVTPIETALRSVSAPGAYFSCDSASISTIAVPVLLDMAAPVLPAATAILPNGDTAWAFSVAGTQYLQVADSDAFSIPTTGALTVEVWLAPGAVNQPHSIGTGYTNFLGKAGYWSPPGSNQCEWELRYFDQSTTDSGNVGESLCGYVFNIGGGIGNGHDDAQGVAVSTWQLMQVVYDFTSSPGVIKIYRNGVLKNSTTGSGITPQNGTAPVIIGANETDEADTSYWYGWLGKAAIYPSALTATRLLAHYNAMATSASATANLAAPGVLAPAAVLTARAAASLAAPGAVTASGTRTVPGTAPLAAAAILTASAGGVASATAPLAGLGVLTAVATGISPVALALAAPGSVAVAGTRTTLATTALSSVPVLAATGIRGVSPGASLAASAALAADGTRSAVAASALAAAAALAASGTRTAAASAALTGQGLLAADGIRGPAGGAGLFAPGTLSASGAGTVPASAPLTAPGALTAAAVATALPSAALAAAAALTAAGTSQVLAVSAMSSSPSLTAAASATTRLAAAALAAPGSLAAAATGTSLAASALTAPPALTASPLVLPIGGAALFAFGSLAASGVRATFAASAMAAQVALAASGNTTLLAVAQMGGSGILSAVPIRSAVVSVTLSAPGLLTAGGTLFGGGNVPGMASLAASPELIAEVTTVFSPELLWEIYTQLEQVAREAYQLWVQVRQAGGTSTQTGLLYHDAYVAETAALQAYEAWRQAERAAIPGAAG